MKLLCCGVQYSKANPSCLRTTNKIISTLEELGNDVNVLDYQLRNPFLKKLHNYYGKLFLGKVSHRDRFDSFFCERNLSKGLRKLTQKPKAILHISNLAIPETVSKQYSNYLYLDAPSFGPEIAGTHKLSSRFKKEHMAVTQKYLNRLKGVFTFNQWTADSLIDNYNIDNNKIYNIGFGAHLLPYDGEKDYTNGKILIVLRRGLEKNKGLYLLRDAFRLARKENPKLSLHVVGTTLETEDGITYYEGLGRDTTIRLFRECSLYAMPAIYEPNGMVYPEALASKTPILGLNRLAFPEFCGYGKYGYIVDNNPADIAKNLLKAFENPTRLQEMGAEGQKFVIERYNWNNVITEMLNTIKSTCI